MAEIRKRYDAEFRAGAVWIVRETGKPIAQVARDLGINEGTLSTWVSREKESSRAAWTPTSVLSCSGSAGRTTSCGWSVACSSDRWSCG